MPKKRLVIAGVLNDLKMTWPQLLLCTFATRIAATFLLLPPIALLLRVVLPTRPEGRLTEADVFGFLLRPEGLLTLLILGVLWIGVAMVEQAGLMTIGYGAIEGRKLSWIDSLRYVGSKLRVILTVMTHLLGRILLMTVPFLVVAALVIGLPLGEHDINYHVVKHPNLVLIVAVLVFLLLSSMFYLLLYWLLRWILAVPAVLFENLGAEAAIRDSVRDSKGHLRELATLFFGAIVILGVSSIVVTYLISLGGQMVVSYAAGSSAEWSIALAMGAVGVVTLALNALVSSLVAALFALASVRIYRDCSGPGELPIIVGEAKPGAGPDLRVPSKRILFRIGCAVVLSVIVTDWILAPIPFTDSVLIIAHRGAGESAPRKHPGAGKNAPNSPEERAAAMVPENTLAAVRDAIVAQADFVEIDVQVSADGEVIVFHDKTFLRFGDESLEIWKATRAELDAIDIGSHVDPKFSNERVPSLEQVLLACCDNRIKMIIELKDYGYSEELAEKVVELVERHGMAEKVVVMSFEPKMIDDVTSLRSDWICGHLVKCKTTTWRIGILILSRRMFDVPGYLLSGVQNGTA